MNEHLLKLIKKMNPWLDNPDVLPVTMADYTPRLQTQTLLLPDWDRMWLMLVGPRQAGKTTLGKFIAQSLMEQGRFDQFLYLNCDFLEVREFLKSPAFIDSLLERFKIERPILFLDEVQRLDNPGLFLKGIADLGLPFKLMASGSSQIELKSSVQEFLTGRQLEALILPFSYRELGVSQTQVVDPDTLIYGLYPAVVRGGKKEIILQQLYNNYINKDIIEILRVGKPDVMQKLIRLLAHTSGQLVNYNQLAVDCRVSVPTIQHYCSILENTYTISTLKPFVGNKRKELVSNPIYYFIDNGFRNQALRQFSSLETRNDAGFLIENAVYQELLKFKVQSFSSFDIHYWRTQSGAEVDFVLYFNEDNIIPIESKYSAMQRPVVSRSYLSFIKAYSPKIGIIITNNFSGHREEEGCLIHFIPFQYLTMMLDVISSRM